MKRILPIGLIWVALLLGCNLQPPGQRPANTTQPTMPTKSIIYSRPVINRKSTGFTRMIFQVRNTSREPLIGLSATVSFYGKDGTLLDSVTQYVGDAATIGIQERANAEIIKSIDGRSDRYEIEFTARGDNYLPEKILSSEVDKIK